VIKRQYICSRENRTGQDIKWQINVVRSVDAVASYHNIHIRYSILISWKPRISSKTLVPEVPNIQVLLYSHFDYTTEIELISYWLHHTVYQHSTETDDVTTCTTWLLTWPPIWCEGHKTHVNVTVDLYLTSPNPYTKLFSSTK
jgi:hypothetical protein